MRNNLLQLCVVVPTFNEAGNVPVLLEKLTSVLKDYSWEVVFVDDDSPDGTVQTLQAIALGDERVRVIRRVGRRGLSSACIEGMLSSAAPYLAVMDADLQHDEHCLPLMFMALHEESYDVAIGTRYMEGGGTGEWSQSRLNISKGATYLTQKILNIQMSDPMSGFFMVRREVLDQAVYRLSSIGFKILLDLVVSSPPGLRIKEIPFQFGQRLAGESKLDARVAWDFVLLLADKTVGRYIPVRLISFAAVGSMGVMVHLTVLTVAKAIFSMPFMQAQTTAVICAMVFNFYLNNLLTYRDQQLRGSNWWSGLFKFMLACGLGGAANVGVANFIFNQEGLWLLSGLAGILVGVMWNYGVTSIWVWPSRRAKS